MTKTKKLLLLLGVLVLLIGAYALVSTLASDEDADTPTEDTPGTEQSAQSEPFFTMNANALRAFSYTKDGTLYQYTLSADATRWTWDEDGTLPLSNGLITLMMNSVLSLTSEQKYNNITADALAEYGLTDTAQRLTFTYADGTQDVLLLGKTNFFNNKTYCCTGEDLTTVYMIDPGIAQNFSALPSDLIEDDRLPRYTEAQFHGFKLVLGEAQYLCDYTYPEDDDTENTQRELLLYAGDAEAEVLPGEVREGLIDTMMGWQLADAVTFDPAKYADYGVADDAASTLTIHYTYTQKVTGAENDQTTSTEIQSVCKLLLGNTAEDGLTYVRLADGCGVYRLDVSPVLALAE